MRVEAVGAALIMVAGLHSRLADISELVLAAARADSHLIDVRTPPLAIPGVPDADDPAEDF